MFTCWMPTIDRGSHSVQHMRPTIIRKRVADSLEEQWNSSESCSRVTVRLTPIPLSFFSRDHPSAFSRELARFSSHACIILPFVADLSRSFFLRERGPSGDGVYPGVARKPTSGQKATSRLLAWAWANRVCHEPRGATNCGRGTTNASGTL